NGFVSAGYVSPAIIEPAVTGGMADINAVSVAAAPTSTALPPMGAGSGNPTWTPLLTPGAAGAAGTDLSGAISAGTKQAALGGRVSVAQGWAGPAQVASRAGATFAGGGWTNAVPPGAGAVGAG